MLLNRAVLIPFVSFANRLLSVDEQNRSADIICVQNAHIYAEVIGYGASSDAYHMVATHPEGIGAYQAMKLAIHEAGIKPEEVDVISAHATSTEIGDKSETLALKKLFGEHAYRIPITANKSMTGHLLGASSAVEAIALVKTLQQGIIPPNH